MLSGHYPELDLAATALKVCNETNVSYLSVLPLLMTWWLFDAGPSTCDFVSLPLDSSLEDSAKRDSCQIGLVSSDCSLLHLHHCNCSHWDLGCRPILDWMLQYITVLLIISLCIFMLILLCLYRAILGDAVCSWFCRCSTLFHCWNLHNAKDQQRLETRVREKD